MRVHGMELRRRVMDDYVKHKDDKKVAMKVLAEKWQVSALVEIQEKQSVQVSLPTIHRELRRLRISLKKLLRTPEQDRPDVAAKRAECLYRQSRVFTGGYIWRFVRVAEIQKPHKLRVFDFSKRQKTIKPIGK